MADLTTLLSQFLYSRLAGFLFGPSGAIEIDTTATGNVGTGEDVLWTYSLPANTLSANGAGLRVTAWGTTAGNTNNKTVKLYFGATMIANSPAVALNNGVWSLQGHVIRTGAATQVALGAYSMTGNTALFPNTSTSPTEDTTAAITVKVTGEATSNDDVVIRGVIVELL